jgi:hypothetical protein
MESRCASPRCTDERAEGSRFCVYHRDLFADVRAEIEAGARARLRSPERKRAEDGTEDRPT